VKTKLGLFGNGKKKKIEFDARTTLPQEIQENPTGWEYTHNFKVHYKSSGLQMIASKLDLSIPSAMPALPSHSDVENAAIERLSGTTLAVNQYKGRVGKRDVVFSYHITNSEYKESLAYVKGQEGW
jgi:hypothetical protein